MTDIKKPIDIVQEIGGFRTIEAARQVFKEKMDKENLSKIEKIETTEVLIKIANAIAMCDPDTIFIVTDTEEDNRFVREFSLKKGEEKKLTMEDHTIHYDLREEQGRIIDKTYYITDPEEFISSLANRIDRPDALEYIQNNMKGLMRGHKMFIGFYMRGPVGSPVANPALEITSSAYVGHSAEILYRNAFSVFDKEIERSGHFFTNIHSEGLNRPEDLPHARVFMDRKKQTTYSFLCTYAGNTLLLKKGNHRFVVDRSVYEYRGTQLAEHMFITGIEEPEGRITWFTGAAPSGCGKTTTAMAGDHFIGDDLAQMRIAEDGSIRSINPEKGIFGILEDVNREGDPVLMDCLRKPGTEVIWSNVLIDDNGVPYWTGCGEDIPDKGFTFYGPWEKGMLDKNGNELPISHPNARCTLNASALSNCSERIEDPDGVVIGVITYSGRDSDTMPPIRVAKDSDHGVVIGACLVSEATTAEIGATGVKRAPWANAPFIPGVLGDYMDSQFKFYGNKLIAANKQPVMAGLNYFLTEEARGGSSKKLLGEKRDVKVWLNWLAKLVHRDIDVIKTPIGNIPKFKDLQKIFETKINKEYTIDLYNKQFSLYLDNILKRIDLQVDAYRKGTHIPERIFEIMDEQKEELFKLKDKYGAVVTPYQLEENDK
ncbi:phosphoenolpyruvate carboxykinase (GTP) [Desulfosarcina sp. BuS5]|uniref:phosphoenolpyruvate carboxykinase (GTP) n=1 Tax=Desulfosarcina sp. BuS5 TaxID=933262 RepID=UPI00048A2243|nr:phosphoenolpyruvate carboxykinase (GTP) [Desulfosarcina sp. BuS5]WDN88848.1 phosphoenolpyruvate carboxykinase (GTP) [Desulfosarcina sp. BuS5]